LVAPPNSPLVWLGTVVPKRHAKRAVTRTLLKRQIRAALLRCGVPGRPLLRPGLWVVRLRAPFDRAQFPSAASLALSGLASSELDILLGQAERELAVAVPGPGGSV
jgi:ribonuclease P protein component